MRLTQMKSVAGDFYPGCGSLGGIFSRLSATNSDWSLVVACAMPFPKRTHVRQLLCKKEGAWRSGSGVEEPPPRTEPRVALQKVPAAN